MKLRQTGVARVSAKAHERPLRTTAWRFAGVPHRALRVVPPPASAADLSEAHGALVQGCTYLIAQRNMPFPMPMSLLAMRRAGNCLMEVDLFLSILLDACARAAGMTGPELAAFERTRDTGRKLRRLDRQDAFAPAVTERLKTVARLRQLATCEGGQTALAPSDLLDLNLRLSQTARNHDLALQIAPQALAQIGQDYLAIGQQLLAHFGNIGRRP